MVVKIMIKEGVTLHSFQELQKNCSLNLSITTTLAIVASRIKVFVFLSKEVSPKSKS